MVMFLRSHHVWCMYILLHVPHANLILELIALIVKVVYVCHTPIKISFMEIPFILSFNVALPHKTLQN